MTEDVATQAGCQSDPTVVAVPQHLLFGTPRNRMYGCHRARYRAARS